jgi:hypothetical protein
MLSLEATSKRDICTSWSVGSSDGSMVAGTGGIGPAGASDRSAIVIEWIVSRDAWPRQGGTQCGYRGRVCAGWRSYRRPAGQG